MVFTLKLHNDQVDRLIVAQWIKLFVLETGTQNQLMKEDF